MEINSGLSVLAIGCFILFPAMLNESYHQQREKHSAAPKRRTRWQRFIADWKERRARKHYRPQIQAGIREAVARHDRERRGAR